MKNDELLISDTSALAKNANILRLRSRSLAQDMKLGNFASMFKGQGVEFSGVREYLYGDDVRSIDWNVTARMDKTFVKLYEEEREQTVFLIVDRSLSMETGSKNYSRLNTATETAALLVLASEYNSCPIGSILFDGKISFLCLPKKSKEHSMLIFSKLANREKQITKGSALQSALKATSKELKARSMIFVISDFRCTNYENELAQLAQKHDVVAIRITDNNDYELPQIGLISAKDLETGKTANLATSSNEFQHLWKESNKNSISQWKYKCKKHGILPLLISTDQDPVIRLSNLFNSKEKF